MSDRATHEKNRLGPLFHQDFDHPPRPWSLPPPLTSSLPARSRFALASLVAWGNLPAVQVAAPCRIRPPIEAPMARQNDANRSGLPNKVLPKSK